MKFCTVATYINVNICAKFGHVISYQSLDLKFRQKQAITKNISFFEHYFLHEIFQLISAIIILSNCKAFTFQKQSSFMIKRSLSDQKLCHVKEEYVF